MAPTAKQLREAAAKAKKALDAANKQALAAGNSAARKKAQAAVAAAQKQHTAAQRALTAGAGAGSAAPATSAGIGQTLKTAVPIAAGGATAGALLINSLSDDPKAPATVAPKNTAVDPSKVKVNPSTVKKQAETQTPQQEAMAKSGSGVVADGRRTDNTPATDNGGLGVNAVTEADRKVNMETDPDSSGYAWGVNRGGRYADATGRRVSPNKIAAGMAADMNENGMPTARQHSMDIEAQLQDKNSPLFQAWDRMQGGALTRAMQWREENVRAPIENKKLLDGVTEEQRKILSKFTSTGEGPEPKIKVYGETPAQEVKAQANSPAGDDTDAYNAAQSGVAPAEVKAQGTAAASTAPTVVDELADLYAGDVPVADVTDSDVEYDENGNPIEPVSDDASTDSEPEPEQSTADMVTGGMLDASGQVDEAGRVGSSISQHGVAKTLTGRGNLAGLQGNATGVMDKFGRVANRVAVGANVLGGLTDTWDELTGTDGSLIAGAVSGGKSFGTETGNKGRRANAWGGTGLASRAAGGAEAFLNGITGGGYDAMRANTWGGDEYVKQRGGKIEKDPLNAGKFAEWASGKLFKKWDDYQNRKSVASTRSQVAANTKANAKRA